MKNFRSYQSVYSLIYFCLFAAISSLNPFFPLVLQSKGFTPARIGQLLGSYEFFSILGLLLIGHFYDKIKSPKRTVFFIAVLCMGLLFSIAGTHSQTLLIPLTLGLGFVIKSPASLVDAHYGQIMPDPQKTYGKARLFGSLGYFSIAMIIQITQWVEGSRPFTVFAGYSLLILSAVLLLMRLPTSPQTGEHQDSVSFMKTARSFPRIYWIGLSIAFLNFLGMSGHYTFFSLLLKNKFGIQNIGGFWAIGPLFEIPLFFFSGWLLKKIGLKFLWVICLAAGVIRMQVYSLAETPTPLYIVQILHSFSFGLNHLAIVTLISKTTSSASRGLAMSIYTAVGMGLSLFIGGFLGGWILECSDYHHLFQFFSVFPLLGIGVSLLFMEGRQKMLREE